jgi:MFS family permease
MVMRMGGAGSVASKVLPSPGLPRSIALQSALVAVGGGIFMTGGVVFFTDVLGLSAVQIGVGISLAGLVGLMASVPLGTLVDRIGGKRSWAIGVIVKAACIATYPLVRGYPMFLLLTMLAAAADASVDFGRTSYTGDALPAGTRLRAMAFARSYSNIGFTVGAGLGAVALAANSHAALVAMALTSAAALAVNAVVVARLPRIAVAVPRGSRGQASRMGAWRDYPYLALSALLSVVWFHAVIFSQIVPLWVITHTDAPKAVLGGLFALNTVIAVVLQVPATIGADTLAGATRLIRWGSWASAIACPVIALSGTTHGWATIGVLALGIVLITGTELWASAATWFIQTEIPPEGRRGAYNGAARTVSSMGRMVAPASLTLLAIQTGGWGWWVVACIFAACALVTQSIVAWVGRTPRSLEPWPAPVCGG